MTNESTCTCERERKSVSTLGSTCPSSPTTVLTIFSTQTPHSYVSCDPAFLAEQFEAFACSWKCRDCIYSHSNATIWALHAHYVEITRNLTLLASCVTIAPFCLPFLRNHLMNFRVSRAQGFYDMLENELKGD